MDIFWNHTLGNIVHLPGYYLERNTVDFCQNMNQWVTWHRLASLRDPYFDFFSELSAGRVSLTAHLPGASLGRPDKSAELKHCAYALSSSTEAFNEVCQVTLYILPT